MTLPRTHWYRVSDATIITCVCIHGKDHGDEGYGLPPENTELAPGDELEVAPGLPHTGSRCTLVEVQPDGKLTVRWPGSGCVQENVGAVWLRKVEPS